jgi:hypothetical protein
VTVAGALPSRLRLLRIVTVIERDVKHCSQDPNVLYEGLRHPPCYRPAITYTPPSSYFTCTALADECVSGLCGVSVGVSQRSRASQKE